MGKIIKAAEIQTVAASETESDSTPRGSRAVSMDEEALRTMIIAVAKEMARLILGRTIDDNPELLNGIYKRAFRRAGPLDNAKLTVHPDDCAFVETRDVDVGNCHIASDDAVGRGGYRLTTPAGEIDGTRDTLLEVFGRTLEETE